MTVFLMTMLGFAVTGYHAGLLLGWLTDKNATPRIVAGLAMAAFGIHRDVKFIERYIGLISLWSIPATTMKEQPHA